MFRSLFGGGSSVEKKKRDERNVPEIEDDQPRNRFNEIQILNGHTDVIHSIIKIDENRVLSTSHDKKGIVWDCETGDILCELVGHTRAISSAILIENYLDEQKSFCDVIVTASSDQTIRVWELTNGQCRKVIKEHQSTVKRFSVVLFEPMLILTAGQDICLWSHSFQLLSKFQRNSLDYVHTFINAKTDRIVTATDQPHLIVYDIKNESDGSSHEEYVIKEFKRLPRHRESITSLVLISDAMFASASMDGAIIVWTTHRLEPTRKFNHYETFMNTLDHTYPYAVQHIMIADQRYIFAAIGTGFAVYDPMLDKCVAKILNAHHSQVTSMVLLDNGTYLATSSLDGTIRLWASPLPKTPEELAKAQQAVTPMSKLVGRRIQDCRVFPIKLELVGMCLAHSSSVQSVIKCGKEGFISCGNDGMVILWKDSELSRRRRDEEFRKVLSKLGWLDH
ncbi:WD repeat-containing protein 41-like [Hydractinia symbiolongicarpus]|uniref:WD repeat-containing protein 41-like n=1 Tax=Hydractinia symbiolongicarpus TaxID=13093 RepID=UPI00254FCEAA|nr:WD repeat-containing protein 41-like [Hydractinia symbiolongicarpus]